MTNRSVFSVAKVGRGRPAAVILAAAITLACGSGCRISSHGHSGDNNVDVATPFGGVDIKTNDAARRATVGLPQYPGATPVHDDHNTGAADIDMSFGSFHLRVKALSYRTPDSPEKVMSFYRDALRRYGDVIECHYGRPVGTPTRTAEGLSCDPSDFGDHQHHDGKEFELKTGSEKHQHLVTIEHEGGGTKFAIVALDLPGGSHGGDGTGEQTE